MGILDLPILRGLRRPRRVVSSLPAARAAGDLAGELGAQLAAVTGSWVPPRRGSRELLAAYADLPWLHAVVRRRAEALGGVEWCLYRRTTPERARRLRGNRSHTSRRSSLRRELEARRLEEIEDHPLLDLLDRPSPGLSGSALLELVSKWLDLVGEAPIIVDRDVLGVPRELVPVVPTWIVKIATPGDPTYTIQAPRGAIEVPARDVIWIRQHDPASPFTGRGVGTAASLADELETDEFMALTAKSRFFNRGAPDVMIGLLGRPGGTGPGADSVAAFSKALEDKHRGVERVGQTHVVSGDFRAQLLQHTMVESQYIEGRRFLRDTCIQVFGTPPEILGVLTNSNRSTIAAAEDHFATFSTTPQAERVRAALQAGLVGDFGDDLVLDFESLIPADVEFQKSMMVALPGAFTINDIRRLAGVDPVDDGDRFYAAPGAGPVVPVEGDAPKQIDDVTDVSTTEAEGEDLEEGTSDAGNA